MNACFADTYYFIALLFENDEAHDTALALTTRLSGRVFTSAWVITEFADAMAAPGRRVQFLPFLDFIRSNPLVTIVPPDQSLLERGVTLYSKRPDKGWSLTDCISFVIMQEHGLTDALTGDHHFKQAGFTALMG
jgi:predicted nucleic acid-binding protein